MTNFLIGQCIFNSALFSICLSVWLFKNWPRRGDVFPKSDVLPKRVKKGVL